MIIVNARHVHKYHGAHLVLSGVNLDIQEGERVGLIGSNGSGKSTLLKLISGRQRADEGQLTLRKHIQVGYLPQIPDEFHSLTVHKVLAFGLRTLWAYKEEMLRLERLMSVQEIAADPAQLDDLLHDYGAAQDKFEAAGGYEADARIDQVAAGLQIDPASYGREFRTLSGGEKTRVVLASQLIVRPDLLLLDEPTNHLDLKGLEWLEQYLQDYTGTYIIVSHDRYFLDKVVTRIIELEDGEAHSYRASYSGYVAEKQERLLQQFAQYQEQQKVVAKMKETIRKLEEWGRNGDNEKFFKRAASMRKALERMELIRRPVLERRSAEFGLTPLDRSGNKVATLEQLDKSFTGRRVLARADASLAYGEKVVLVGDNGSGKTTLFRVMLGEESADGGQVTLGARVRLGYLAQQQAVPDGKQTVLDYFRLEARLEEGEARGILARYLFYGADVFRSLCQLSGGEWTRLRLALLILDKPNLLLLDEPTNHLDIASREALEEALEEFPGTVLVISHDRYLINRLADRIWELNQGQLTSHLGSFDEYRMKRLRQESGAAAARMPEKNGQSQQAATPAAVTATAEARPLRAGTEAGSSRQRERERERLELALAGLEAELAAADAELERLGAEEGGAAELERRWREREALQARLDAMMEAWLELE
ncbi:ABC-F family ATP-binding cassette domain-containing protein [Paenibacillus filicis]|uniref:ABC-F family ATP-binding cassette domain-containing protein n=1 Tax=Paenibacillus filicis TaxID=669464 RepID=A0ABU9DRK8_9BACL